MYRRRCRGASPARRVSSPAEVTAETVASLPAATGDGQVAERLPPDACPRPTTAKDSPAAQRRGPQQPPRVSGTVEKAAFGPRPPAARSCRDGGDGSSQRVVQDHTQILDSPTPPPAGTDVSRVTDV